MHIRRIILQIVAYTLYALVAFVVFVYLMFPYDLLQQRLVEWASQDGVQLGLTRLRPAFPPGLRVEGIRLQVDQLSPSDAAMSIETLRVQPDWLALLSRKMQVRFQAGLYSGRLEGDVHYTKVEGAPLWEIKTRFADLDMAQHALLRKDDKAFMRGRLSGDSAVTLTSDGQMPEGSANMRVQSMVLAGVPGLQLPREIVCDTLQGELKTTAKQGGTVSLTCQGKDLAIEAHGTVGWKAPLKDSQLNVGWHVRYEEAYKSDVDFLAPLLPLRKRPERRGELSFRLQGPLLQSRLVPG